MINKIYKSMKKDLNNHMEIISDLKYYNKSGEGIEIYFPDGTIYKMFKYINDKECLKFGYLLIDEDFFPIVISDSINEFVRISKRMICRYNEILISEGHEI